MATARNRALFVLAVVVAVALWLLTAPRDGYRRYAERLTEFNCAVAANLHNGTSAAQRRAAVKKLASWEGDLRAIVAQANRQGS